MAEADILKYIDVQIPTMEVVMLEATDTETYLSRKFEKVQAAVACWNENQDDTISVCNSDNEPIDGTDNEVRLNSSTLSNHAVLLVLWGDEGKFAA